VLDILVWPRSTDELRIWGSGPLPPRLGFGPTLTKPVCRDRVANPKSNRARPWVYSVAYIRKGDPSRFPTDLHEFHVLAHVNLNPNPPTDR
jgi:hypothetical protein